MSIKYAILGLLHYQDMHGYRIKAHLERNFGHMWSINFGQIYPNLKQLEEDGLLRRARAAPANGGPARKLYAITPAGRRAFSRWLASPAERTLLLRDPFLLRFVFFDFGSREQAIEQIDRETRRSRGQLERRRENLEHWKRQGVYVRRVAELGMLFNQMFLDWLGRTRRELARCPEKEFLSALESLAVDGTGPGRGDQGFPRRSRPS